MTITAYPPSSFMSRLKECVMLLAEAVGIGPAPLKLERLFADTVRTHDAMIRRICLGYAHTTQDLEDLYQDVLVNIWRGLPDFKGQSSVRTWIYRITLNTCVSSIRLRSRRVEYTPIEGVIEVADDSAESHQAVNDLYECIATLTSVDKAIVMMWLDEYTYDEIAEIVGLNRNSVATRLHRAKQKLKRNYL